MIMTYIGWVLLAAGGILQAISVDHDDRFSRLLAGFVAMVLLVTGAVVLLVTGAGMI